MDDVRAAELDLEITGAEDGYRLAGHSSMREISRDPDDLVRQSLSEHHYPDGFVLFLGTLLAPTQDSDEPGRGFPHKIGDRVSIATPWLGPPVIHVVHSNHAAPWTEGNGPVIATLPAPGLPGRPPCSLPASI